jgi:hypothetical protein
MHEAPRPDELGEQRTPVAPEPKDEPGATDPRSEPGARGAVAKVPYWFIVGAVIVVAVVALYLAWTFFPAR